MIATDVVRRLVNAQFPHWADLPLAPLESAGVDNAMVRLGDELVVRLPLVKRSVAPLEKEQRWTPHLAPHLSLETPTLCGIGRPGDGFPWPWSVQTWIDGAPVRDDDVANWSDLATTLATFIVELRRAPVHGGPSPGDHNFGRGAPLATRETATRTAIGRLDGVIDVAAAAAAWARDAAAPAWDGPPCWIHGDLHAHNLLLRDGRLAAAIDFGGLGVGDPACDLAAAWRLLPAHARGAFRAALAADDATWSRARAWALSISVRELEFYGDSAPALSAIAHRRRGAGGGVSSAHKDWRRRLRPVSMQICSLFVPDAADCIAVCKPSPKADLQTVPHPSAGPSP